MVVGYMPYVYEIKLCLTQLKYIVWVKLSGTTIRDTLIGVLRSL